MKNLFVLLLFSSFTFFGQTGKKQINIKKVTKAPDIDAVLNDQAWSDAEEAKDFVMFRPGTGTPEPETHKTVVKFCYDDEAIYIGAYLYDDHPETIPMQFSTRDNFAQADFFLVAINPNNDGVNDTEFVVLSTGTQADAKVSSANGEDFGWSAVWESATKMNDDGWCVEMKIPFSALRFSNGNPQSWGMNIHRRIQSKKEQYSWNFIDKTTGSYTEYSGLLSGISDVKTPVRLSFYPYAQTSLIHYNGNTDWLKTAGMDLKYGINESFTLDATLIPDFGQTAFDDVVLNLGPFEQQYQEKRAFFTEGTELFAKGDLFYSRRVGNRPLGYFNVYDQLEETEIIKENPEKAKLINGIKLSGRNKNGLGIGVFNALVNQTYATVKNTETNTTREILTSPLTNFNALVLDQQFKNTSSITLVNSNVLRKGNYYDANVTSLLTDIRVLKNKYSFRSDFSVSHKTDLSNNTGFQGSVRFNKITGAHRFILGGELSDTKYDKNDFGIQYYNNYVNLYGNYNYRLFEPKGKLNSFYLNFNANYNRLYKPSLYTSNSFNINFNSTTKKELSFGGGTNFHFGTEKDYYEPRVPGRYYINHQINNLFAWISTDYRKKLALDATLVYGTQLGWNDPAKGPFVEITPRYRFSDKFQMIYSFAHDITDSDRGFVTILDDDTIVFGKRDTKTYTNTLNGTYNFSTKSALSLSLRHYWAPVVYKEFYDLQMDGTLRSLNYSENHDINFNAWNFDLSYAWELAPGSQLVALYRNSVYKGDQNSRFTFGKNFNNLMEDPLEHQLSLKFIYYIDYNKL